MLSDAYIFHFIFHVVPKQENKRSIQDHIRKKIKKGKKNFWLQAWNYSMEHHRVNGQGCSFKVYFVDSITDNTLDIGWAKVRAMQLHAQGLLLISAEMQVFLSLLCLPSDICRAEFLEPYVSFSCPLELQVASMWRT